MKYKVGDKVISFGKILTITQVIAFERPIVHKGKKLYCSYKTLIDGEEYCIGAYGLLPANKFFRKLYEIKETNFTLNGIQDGT